jgi:hypothetical protein
MQGYPKGKIGLASGHPGPRVFDHFELLKLKVVSYT